MRKSTDCKRTYNGITDERSSAPRTVELVIFDCDGVLIDSEVISAEVIVQRLADEGVTLDVNYVYRHFLGRSFINVADEVRRNFATKLPESFESDYRRELLKAFEERLRPTPGVESVLSNLGVESCVATSSSPPRTQRALELAGLSKFFGRRVFTASEVERGKPAPDLFLHAAKSMKAAPANCLVVEDTLVGLEAASAAGMSVWRYTGGSHLLGVANRLPESLARIPVIKSWDEFFRRAPHLKTTHSMPGARDGR